MDYRNMDMELFEYSVKANHEQFRVRVESSPTLDQKPSQAVIVRMPKGLRTKLKALERRELTPEELHDLGVIMGQMLFPKQQMQDAVANNLNEIGPNNGLRIRLKLDEYALADLPWEYACLENLEPCSCLVLNGRISLVRYEQLAGTKIGLQPLGEDSLRLSALFADPQDSLDYAHLDLEPEAAKIRSALAKVAGLTAKFEFQPTVDSLTSALTPGTHIMHFAGHGKFVKTMGQAFRTVEGKGYLVLVDEQHHAREFPVDKFLLNLQGCDVRLAVLGACESARQDGANAWTGIAPALARIGIPAVIGMQYGIRNANATAFSAHFYTALAQGESIDWAMSKARLAIHNRSDDPNERDWGVPVLYLRMRSEETDAALFQRLARAQGTTPPRQGFGIMLSVAPSRCCRSCGAAVPFGAKYCTQCPTPLVFCPECNGVIAPTDLWCPWCKRQDPNH